jgi:HEPN domain-containing protein
LTAPTQLRLLADEYRSAAHALRQLGRPRAPLSRAPFRLTAIHAIELYLNALLLDRGHEPGRVRGLQHDLAKRAALAADAGLKLKAKTAAHLAALALNREYLATRYSPELQGPSELTRLVATLEEVAAKVTSAMQTGRPCSDGNSCL